MSGYDLRKVFAETALGSYSSSPGAICPALARLEKQGLVIGEEDRSKWNAGRVRLTGTVSRPCFSLCAYKSPSS